MLNSNHVHEAEEKAEEVIVSVNKKGQHRRHLIKNYYRVAQRTKTTLTTFSEIVIQLRSTTLDYISSPIQLLHNAIVTSSLEEEKLDVWK